MSQHSAHTHYRGRKVVVVAGYDRALNDLFLQVLGHEDAPRAVEECVLYSSLHEPHRDWTDINAVSDKLTELGIEVPDSLLEAVYLDQLFHAGNRMVRHHLNQPPEVFLVG
ncbi:hypothetical protein [Rhodoferax sediminis]|uniref:Uncharacterized protein n=1 Tax=Rhodoferax sediminis TaxID=2509614 RepID=A0A515DDS8_9BURK|nr:hypothetical protein [Rhodoferax sediminis]QDL38547.1 hypothetical protein EUB48_15560 [Rhodoferax sediminis]